MHGTLRAESQGLLRVPTHAEKHADFAMLVSRFHADLLRVAYVVLGDRALAEDAAQAAWTRAWLRFDQLRDPGKVRSWLVAVAANEARQIARRRRPRLEAGSASSFGAEADPALIDLSRALAGLAVEDRQLLALRYVVGLTSAEIGSQLGLSAGAVRHRLMRVTGRLREEMRDDGRA
jgi:RNA polymerase sigma-70 factor (ECF subfamily)